MASAQPYSGTPEERVPSSNVSSTAQAYLERIDPLIRMTAGSLHTDVDFAIIAYLLEKKEAAFGEIIKGLRLKKNLVVYSLRKMVMNGVLVNYYQKKGDPPKEYSTYELSDFTKDLFNTLQGMLRGVPIEMTFFQEEINLLSSRFRYLSKELTILYSNIQEETANLLYNDGPFMNQIGKFPDQEDIIPNIVRDDLTWSHFMTALNRSINKYSSQIRIFATKSEINTEIVKWMILTQMTGQLVLIRVFAELQEVFRKVWRKARMAREEKTEKLLELIELRDFDALRELKLLRSKRY